MLKRFSNCKKNNNDEVLIAFKEILHLMVYVINDKDVKTETQLNMLKKFILHPGDLMIEKKTGTKVIQIITRNLKFDGIKKLCQLYRNIIENKIVKKKDDIKSDLWTNTERSYAAQLLTRYKYKLRIIYKMHNKIIIFIVMIGVETAYSIFIIV